MRLVSYSVRGRLAFGALIGGELIADLSDGRWQSMNELLGDLSTDRLAHAIAAAPTLPVASVQITVPNPHAEKIFCAGLNYKSHASEAGVPTPEFPAVFLRSRNSFVGHQQDVLKPAASAAFDFEAELAVIIGKRSRRVPIPNAMDSVAGYTLLADHTARDVVSKHSLIAGKNYFHSGSFGPWIVTQDEIPRVATLELIGRLNGVEMQRAPLSELIFDVATLVSYLSGITELAPGDVIATGTPAGIGAKRNPPVFMNHGDVFEVEVPGIGVLSNRVVHDPAD